MNGLPGYGTYPTADGQWVALGVLTEAPFWSGLCRGLGLEHLDGLDLAQRIERKQELDAAVAEEIARRPLTEVVAALKKHDVPVSPVLDRDEMLQLDHFRQRGTVISDVDLLGEGRSVMGHPARYELPPSSLTRPRAGSGRRSHLLVDGAMTSPAGEWGLRTVPALTRAKVPVRGLVERRFTGICHRECRRRATRPANENPLGGPALGGNLWRGSQ